MKFGNCCATHLVLPHLQLTYHCKLACLTYNSLTTGQPVYLRSLINYYTPATLYNQLTNFILIVHGSPLNLAKHPSATLHPQSGMICLLIQGSPPAPIPLSAISRQSSLHSLPGTSAAHLGTAGASDSALLLCALQISILLLLLLLLLYYYYYSIY